MLVRTGVQVLNATQGSSYGEGTNRTILANPWGTGGTPAKSRRDGEAKRIEPLPLPQNNGNGVSLSHDR